MTPEQALNKLRGLEADGAAELASVLEQSIAKLDGRNQDLISEKRNLAQRNMALGETLDAVAKGLNLEGVLDRDEQGTYLLGEKASDLPVMVQDVRRAKEDLATKAETFEQQLTEAQGKVQTFERQGKLTAIATAAEANAAVLEKLFGDQLDSLVVADDGVKIGEKNLREAMEADAALKPFIPAMFTSTTPDPAPAAKPAPKLPGGSPAPAPAADPVSAYMNKAYKGAAALGIGGKKE